MIYTIEGIFKNWFDLILKETSSMAQKIVDDWSTSFSCTFTKANTVSTKTSKDLSSGKSST